MRARFLESGVLKKLQRLAEDETRRPLGAPRMRGRSQQAGVSKKLQRLAEGETRRLRPSGARTELGTHGARANGPRGEQTPVGRSFSPELRCSS
jgi:hypothetical protein